MVTVVVRPSEFRLPVVHHRQVPPLLKRGQQPRRLFVLLSQPPLRTSSTGFTNACVQTVHHLAPPLFNEAIRSLSSTLISRVILNLRASSRSDRVIFQPSAPHVAEHADDPGPERRPTRGTIGIGCGRRWHLRHGRHIRRHRWHWQPDRGSGVQGEEALPTSSAASMHQEEN
jgi:hypothetical protein